MAGAASLCSVQSEEAICLVLTEGTIQLPLASVGIDLNPVPDFSMQMRILNMHRALNQAVGRCIRHRGNYGAILLLDS